MTTYSENLALNKTYISSSNQETAQNSFDGDTSTYWTTSSRGQAVAGQEWIGVDFGDPQEIKKISLLQSDPVAIQDVTVEASNDAISWESVVPLQFNMSLLSEPQQFEIGTSVSRRYWRIRPKSSPSTMASGIVSPIDEWWIVKELQMFSIVPEEPAGPLPGANNPENWIKVRLDNITVNYQK